ncbi:MAG: hypothetical protein ACXAB2_10670 [Candidatus Hodarchaeales archaeon]
MKEKCYYHPDRKAKQKCASCGKPLCKEDIKEKFTREHLRQCPKIYLLMCCYISKDFSDYYYCSECFEKKYRKKVGEQFCPHCGQPVVTTLACSSCGGSLK